MNKNKLLFLTMISHSPLFRITDDSSFGAITSESHMKELRISLISFNFGMRIFHIFTVNHFLSRTRKWNILLIIHLDTVINFETKMRKIGDDYDIYKNGLQVRNVSDSLSPEREYILHKISLVESVRGKTFNKYLAYIAIFAILAPLYITAMTNMTFFNSIFEFLLISLLIYLVVNFTILLYVFIKVRITERTTFSSLKRAPNQEIELNASLFYEWRVLEAESNYDVTLIKNIEKYLFSIIIFSVFSIAIIHSEDLVIMMKDPKQSSIAFQEKSSLIVLQNVLGFDNFLKKNKPSITDIQNRLLENRYDQIIIISSENNPITRELIILLQLYNSSHASVITILDETHIDHIEIILLEES